MLFIFIIFPVTSRSSTQQGTLQKEVKVAQGAAFRPGTFQNLKSQLKAYSLFCATHRYKLCPCTSQKLCEYVCFLSSSFKSFFSVKNYLSGVNTWSHILNFNIEHLVLQNSN